MTTDRPNILVIMADQLAAPFVSWHGGPAITPHLNDVERGRRR